MTDYYIAAHASQYGVGCSTVTRREGCVWTTVTNGIRSISGGRYRPTPDAIHNLLPKAQETNPLTPGWSITDAIKAAGRYGVHLNDHTGEGWEALVAFHDAGKFVLVQGDSDQFPNGTCSGAFDGDHCIGITPQSKVEEGERWFYIHDPVCDEGRWAKEAVLKRYASKLYAGIRFAVFVQSVPHYEWRWDVDAADKAFRTYTVHVAAKTWTSPSVLQETDGTHPYHCTAPALFRHDPRPGETLKASKSLVHLRERTDDKPGRYVEKWVSATKARKVLIG